MIKGLLNKLPILGLTLFLSFVASSTALGSATIVIQNNDQPNVGFNDPTQVSPVGGNAGTTLGQQRLNAFQFAADIWGATLTSSPTITVQASWSTTMTCTANSGALGSAGATQSRFNFANAPFTNTWYGIALANKLAGTDLNDATPEINAQFNLRIGQADCLASRFWYLGLDGNHGSGIDLVAVLLHELSHGLGFQTFTSSSTGVQPSGLPSIYDRFLFDNTSGKSWIQMTNAERVASAINNNLVWTGPQVTSDVPNVLDANGTPRLTVNSPASIAGNYQVGTADFGPPVSSPGITNSVILASPVDACSPITNGAAISGRIALLDRGSCNFTVKVKNVQDAGGLAAIIADNVTQSTPPGLGGSDPTITIPSVSVTMNDGNTIKAQLGTGVNATLRLDLSAPAGADSSGRIKLYAPNPVAPGSSVSHFDTSAFPNQLMEPNISSDLTHNVTPPSDLTFSLFTDIGWTLAGGPPPSPTPTPSPPANDNFANAQVVSGCAGSVNGSNVGATTEAGEPNHSPDVPRSTRSVWYQWQSPGSGSVTVTTAGSDFDTVLAVYTGNALNSLTLLGKNDDVDPGVVVTSTVTFTATAGTIYKIAVDGYNNGGSGGDVGSITLNWAASNCGSPSVRFDSANLIVGEGAGASVVSVTRIGDPSAPATVNYATSDTAGLTNCTVFNGTASERCDYGTTVGTLRFAAGETNKVFLIPIVDDAFIEGNETFTVTLSAPTGATLGSPQTATVTIGENDGAPASQNPIDGVQFFVTQQYIDFLGRLPDSTGLANWMATLNGCPNGGFGEFDNPGCDRVHVSAGFFLSAEFQGRGYWAYRFYEVGLDRRATYAEFVPDMAQVGGSQSPESEALSKAAYTDAFVQRSEFKARYDALSNAAYVNALEANAEVTVGNKAALLAALNGGQMTRGQVLRDIIESQAVADRFFNRAFVAMQYFGYLRRDPDTIGFQNWLTTLNSDPNNYRHMIFGFLFSTEYRQRFGP